MNKATWIIIIVVIVLAAAAGLYFFNKPAEPPAASPNIPAELQPMAERAIGIAASTFHVKPEEITVLSIQPVTWANSSLGCPQEGQMYLQEEMPGYLATVEISGKTHSVHMNEKGQGVVCPPEQAQPPASTN